MENPALQLLLRKPFPELAAALRQSQSRILERFRQMITELLPAADQMTLAELLDHLPKTLDDLAITLSSTSGAKQRDFLADSRLHGDCRYHQSYNLGELLLEYNMLRTITLEEVTLALGRPPGIDEISGLNAGLDAASRRAVETFVAYQKEEIRASSEAYSKYLSFLSHDLRGNLNGILLMMEVLRRELSPHQQFTGSLDDLELMRRSILDTVATMDRFLHAERFRRGKVEVKISEVNLGRLLPDIVNQFTQQAKGKGIEIVSDTTACPSVRTDRDLLSMIVQNLVSNAVKYTQQGIVRVVAEPDAHGGCRISVADQGPGIAPEMLKDIFQPFTRGQTHGQGGAGLGLSIARQAADLLGAKLYASSAGLGAGATFTLDLIANPEKDSTSKTDSAAKKDSAAGEV